MPGAATFGKATAKWAAFAIKFDNVTIHLPAKEPA